MKVSFAWVVLGLVILVMFAGCTNQETSKSVQPQTTKSITAVPTQVETTIPATPVNQIVSDPALENWIETWAFSETIHSRSYTHIIRNVFENPSETPCEGTRPTGTGDHCRGLQVWPGASGESRSDWGD